MNKKTINQKTENFALLLPLSEAERSKWLKKCTTRKYASGESIVRHSEQDNNLYLIQSGEVRVMLVSHIGREVCFANLHAGENFGELSLLDGKPREANVVATTAAVMVVMSQKVFNELLLAHTLVIWTLLHQMVASTRLARERRYELIAMPIVSRIHKELLRLSEGNVDLDGVVRIANMPIHEHLASRIGCNREAVSRELKRLKGLKILSVKKRVLIIHDLNALQDMFDAVAN